MSYFVVVNEQGPAWVPSRSMRDQEDWREHAEFVNALVREGFILLAGPLGNGPVHQALLVVSTDSERTIRTRFAEDPWIRSGILRTVRVEPWKVLASDDRLDRVLSEITQPR